MPAGPLALLLLALLARASPLMEQVLTWADLLGGQLHHFGEAVVRRQEAQAAFRASSRVLPHKGPELLFSIAREVERMMRMKIAAVKELVDRAEEAWRNSPYNVSTSPLFQFRDAKRLNVTKPFVRENIELKENGHFFGSKVNTSFSVVHVPTSVYEGEPHVLRGIQWSLDLDEVFLENYKKDPSLYWQYFGSSLGFMRRYPASWWDPKPPVKVKWPPDLFDCRTRAWYVEAASSPKDILILVDNSGSMTGQKRELARHVVFEILETLGSNDYVNILSFNVTVLEVVCCFKDRLVQANLANIRDLKMGMEGLEKARNITDFPVALNESFRILRDFRQAKRGSNCNQAIMLITDGSPETYQELFDVWNWFNRPHIPVRIFTYLIGAEADLREMKWMACANRGYFGHISVTAEVRELVMRYVSVMARPLVLNNTYHPVVWAPVYADIVDPKMTDYLWELKEREIQKEKSLLLRRTQLYKDWRSGKFKRKKQKDKTLKEIANMAIHDEQLKDDREYLIDTTIKRYPYKLMTSVSMPVYDTRSNYSVEANILGVAGTDVPNFEIQRLMVPHMLGVNGYAFIVTNNGYIIIHPELRPEFQVSINGTIVSILKPNYNNVDFMDVEHPAKNFEDEEPEMFDKNYNDRGERCSNEDEFKKPKLTREKYPCRKYNPDLVILREKLINGVCNGSTTLWSKAHYDGLRRVYLSKKHYFYTSINEAPFELVIVLPDGYGLNRIEPKPEITSRQNPRRKKDFFKDPNWKIHPNWYYCKYHSTGLHYFNSSEEELLHFLNKISQPGWKWPKPPRGTPEHYHCHLCNTFWENDLETPNFYCDKTLIQSLLSDAKATEWFSESINYDSKQKFGLVLVFIATKSGLMRWQDMHPQYKAESGENHFSEVHRSAIDETWYKRAVEQYYVDPQDFVYSVPFGVGDKEGTLVTASQAVFLVNGSSEAPAAVVGFQFKHSSLHSLFINITYSSHKYKGVKSCESAIYACYILDNHGYIIVSENLNETGKFFGEIQGAVMENMVKEKVYNKTDIHDYQAVCFVEPPSNEDDKSYYDNRLYINRTRPQPCETKVDLFMLNRSNRLKNGISAMQCARPYFVKDIGHSNLILVVVNTSCIIENNVTLLAQPEEIKYEPFWCCKSNRNLTRRNVAECANFDEMEEYIHNVCGNAPTLLASVFLIVFLMMATQVVMR